MSPNLLIYGAGGHAREVAWLAQSCQIDGKPVSIGCFIDDGETLAGKRLNTIPVISLEQARHCYPLARVVVAIGNPETRMQVAKRASDAGFSSATLIHPDVEISEWVDIGNGVVICAGSVITTNISLGRHVHVNLGCTISHDCILGDFCTLAPGVHISGWVHIGERVSIGTGAVVINGTEHAPLLIGNSAVIGAGACVTKSVEPRTTVVGVPAKPLQRNR